MAHLRGTVFERPNSTFTVLTEPTWDPKQGRYRRTSLGTFKTKEEARDELVRYNAGRVDGVFSRSEVEQRRVRLDRYLADWLDLVERERLVGRIALRTQRDYETVVRCHILPYLGQRRIGDLTTPLLHGYLRSAKSQEARRVLSS